MTTAIRTYLKKFILLVLAVQILNLSVYGGDFDLPSPGARQAKIGEFNQIDSLIEYVAEIMLDHKNAFPENGSHNPNSKSSRQIKHASMKMIDMKIVAEVPLYSTVRNLPGDFIQDYKKLILKEINPPPPKACTKPLIF